MTLESILWNMLAEIDAFAELPQDVLTSSTESRLRGLRQKGVPVSTSAWFGPLSASARKAASRVMRRLARLGLVERVTDASRDRVRYLRPTPLGLAVAFDLAHGRADLDAVVEGLKRTEWGPDLVAPFLTIVRSWEAKPAAAQSEQPSYLSATNAPVPDLLVPSVSIAKPNSSASARTSAASETLTTTQTPPEVF